ncbi:hypothetical protein [Desulfosporosinus fructosivorans]
MIGKREGENLGGCEVAPLTLGAVAGMLDNLVSTAASVHPWTQVPM